MSKSKIKIKKTVTQTWKSTLNNEAINIRLECGPSKTMGVAIFTLN